MSNIDVAVKLILAQCTANVKRKISRLIRCVPIQIAKMAMKIWTKTSLKTLSEYYPYSAYHFPVLRNKNKVCLCL